MEKTFTKRIRNGGTSLIVTIPKEIEASGFKDGDLCDFTIKRINDTGDDSNVSEWSSNPIRTGRKEWENP